MLVCASEFDFAVGNHLYCQFKLYRKARARSVSAAIMTAIYMERRLIYQLSQVSIVW